MTVMTEDVLRRTWPALLIALGAVVAGGLLSAITAHAATQAASWASAYLVLVVGVGTAGLAVGRALFTPAGSQVGWQRTELIVWLLGNALVLAGTLLSPAWLVDAGSVLLVFALGSLLAGVYKGEGPALLRGLFLTLVAVLLLSIPIGLLISHFRR